MALVASRDRVVCWRVVEWRRIRMGAKGKGAEAACGRWMGAWSRRSVCAQQDHSVFGTPG